MHDRPTLSEFSGVAGEVLRRSLSLSSLLSGLALAFVLVVGNWVLIAAGTPGATSPFTQVVFALATARFALNGLYGEWSGTVFSTRGGSWVAVVGICLRYLMLTAIWFVPLLLLGPGEDEIAQLAMLGPAAAGRVLGMLGLYMLALMLTPPVFLIVATKAESFAEPFTPELWRSTFGGRLGDLLVVYAMYVGGVTMCFVLSLPALLLGFAIGKAPGFLALAALGCLVLGVSTNLLGRLCGFFACGELGLETASSDRATRRPMPDDGRAAAAVPPAPVAPLAVSGADPTPVAAVPVAPVAVSGSAASSPPAAAAAAPAVAPTSQLPPLLEAQPRVQKLMQRLEAEPQVVLSALEDLHRSYAPNPSVLHALVVARNRNGDVESALELARHALPMCFERGNLQLAAVIFRELRAHAEALDVSRDQRITIGSTLYKMGDLNAAAQTFTLVLAEDPGETRAIKGLLQVGDRILEKTRRPDQAAKVYRYLIDHCGQSPLAEYMHRGLETAERAMR